MKKISLLTLGAIFAMNVSAQDLGVESIIVKSKVDTGWATITNDTIFTNDTVYLGVLFKNHGSAFININDSIAFAVSINGAPAVTYGTVIVKNITPLAGDNTAELIIKKDEIFITPIPGAKVCAWPVFWSKSNMGGSTANDTACNTFDIAARVINVKAFSPTEGKAGTDVTISGSYFGVDVANNIVKFSGELAVIKSANANTIIATVPGAAVSGNITVEASGKTGTSTNGFIVLDASGNPKNALSIADIQEISSFIGFSNNELVISTGDVISDLKIFDLTGKVVLTTSDISSNTVHTHNLNDLQSGVYIATYGSEYLKFSK